MRFIGSSKTETDTTFPALTPRRNHRGLLIASAPLLFLGASCLLAVGQRAVAARGADTPFGHLSSSEARNVAGKVCAEATGQRVVTLDTTSQSAYSNRRSTVVREWNVTCQAADGNLYLTRINADTGQVYAINRMESKNASSETGEVTRTEAEARARQYLGLVGVPSSDLKPISESSSKSDETNKPENAQWNFTYSHKVPGMGDRLLKVSVDGKDGGLEHVWNPVSAL